MAIAPGSTLADYLVPARPSRAGRLLRGGILIVGSTLLLALSAHIQIALPFTPVPFTLQMLVVVLTAAALGSRRGTLVMLIYLAEGASGIPVFAKGGGLLYLLGPTAGYLWSYPLAAFVVGWLCEMGLDRRFMTAILAMLPGMLILYVIGVPWLAIVLHINLAQAFTIGMLPFIPGDLAKLIIATALLPTAWRIVRVVRNDQ